MLSICDLLWPSIGLSAHKPLIFILMIIVNEIIYLLTLTMLGLQNLLKFVKYNSCAKERNVGIVVVIDHLLPFSDMFVT